MTVNLHEIIHTVPGQEERYMTSILSHTARRRWLGAEAAARDTLPPAQVGFFRTAEVSGRWPKVVNIWGPKPWHDLVANFEMQFHGDAGDLEEWWNRNLVLRTGGYDRVLLPAAFSPDSAEIDNRTGRVFLQEILQLRWGDVDAYLDRLQRFLPAAERLGWRLVGAYRVAFRPCEVLVVWSMASWQAMSALLAATADPEAAEFAAARQQLVSGCEEMVLIPGRVSRLRMADGGA